MNETNRIFIVGIGEKTSIVETKKGVNAVRDWACKRAAIDIKPASTQGVLQATRDGAEEVVID